MTIELKHIRQFIVVAETLNFHRAAETLAIAQPALSRNIQTLEHRVGVPLLQRNNRQVSLTAAGQAFLHACNGLSQQLDHALLRARQAHDGLRGELHIGYTDFAIAGTLPRLLHHFRQRFPDIALHMNYAATEQQMEWLESGRIDIAFLTQPVSGTGLTHLPIQAEALGVCMPVFHPLADSRQLTLPALHDENWIFGEPALWRQYRRLTERLFIEAGYAPRIVQEAYNTDCIMGLVAAGLGITLHLPHANARHRDDVVFIPLAGDVPPIVTEAVWHADTGCAALKAFVTVLQEMKDRHDKPRPSDDEPGRHAFALPTAAADSRM